MTMREEDVIYELVAALAAADAVAPAELEYDLLEYIHPEALVNMLAVDSDFWEFTFQVPRHEVTVTHAGEIFIDGSRRGSVQEEPPDAETNVGHYIQEELRRRQTLLDNIPCMLYRCRNQHSWPMEFVNGACEEVTGYDPNAFVIGGVSYGEDLIHPADRQSVWDSVQQSIRAGEQFSQTHRIRTADGEQKRVWNKGVGVFDGDEAIALVGFVTALSADIHADASDLCEQ